MTDLTGSFEPDPDFELDAETRSRILPWYDPDALVHFLSGLMPEVRPVLLEGFFTSPGGEDKSIPQFGGPGLADPRMRAALMAVFSPLHAMNPELAKK